MPLSKGLFIDRKRPREAGASRIRAATRKLEGAEPAQQFGEVPVVRPKHLRLQGERESEEALRLRVPSKLCARTGPSSDDFSSKGGAALVGGVGDFQSFAE